MQFCGYLELLLNFSRGHPFMLIALPHKVGSEELCKHEASDSYKNGLQKTYVQQDT